MLDANVIIKKTLRVPRVDGPSGDGAAVARQLDALLLGVGFTCSRELLEHITSLATAAAIDLALEVLAAVRELVGGHVAQNPYFKHFPRDIPDTLEFWSHCLRQALLTHAVDRFGVTAPQGWVDLLNLPTYGRYRHTHAEMLAAHDELITSVKDRVTVLHLGETLERENAELYRLLASSPTPLGEGDQVLLYQLATHYLAGPHPTNIPVRENRAILNSARLNAGLPLVDVDSVVDVLRAACHHSGGDVTLAAPTRFRRIGRPQRRAMMAALNIVIARERGRLGDITRYREQFKRLGERLHPHEFPNHPFAQSVFAVARAEITVGSLPADAEAAFAAGDTARAVSMLVYSPGLLLRSLDRALRQATPHEVGAVLDGAEQAASYASGRVLCSLREHLLNRGAPAAARVFTNRHRRTWVTADTRPPLPPEVAARAADMLDTELRRRVDAHEHIVVDPAVLDVAVPLSGKNTEAGFAVLPRGTRSRVDGEVLRFFTYWRQRERRTDFDLSALLLDDDFADAGHVSWTNYHSDGAVYSGDITDAPDGATEFIDIPLDTIRARYLVPQVNIYSGEGFDEVDESMFGWMTRDRDQAGAPFEPRTVRTRSEMRGTGRVALPIMFARGDDGTWTAHWTHLYLAGSPRFNQVEGNHLTTSKLARAVIEREYLTVAYLLEMLRPKAGRIQTWNPGATELDGPVTFIGLTRPDGLPAGSTVITPDRVNELIPH